MPAALLAVLTVVLGQGAVARGDLRKLERLADRLEVVVRHERSNLLSKSALAELRRWPGLPVVELLPPLTRLEARALRQLPRLGVRLYPGNMVPRYQLKRLGASLLRVDERAPLDAGEAPCARAELWRGAGDAELRLKAGVDDCALRWLAAELEPAHQPPRQ